MMLFSGVLRNALRNYIIIKLLHNFFICYSLGYTFFTGS